MSKAGPIVRRRNDADETRRRVLDAVIATIIDIGYYKASSNEIARRAGVTWGSIQHLFGSREQLMLDVVNDIGVNMEQRFGKAEIKGDTLEERLENVVKVLSTHYEQDIYLVQIQILLELSSNPKMSRGRRAVQRRNSEVVDHLARPLLAKAIGPAADDHELVLFTFLTLRGYLGTLSLGRRIAEMRDGTVLKLVSGGGSEDMIRTLLVNSVAATIRAEAKRRGHKLN